MDLLPEFDDELELPKKRFTRTVAPTKAIVANANLRAWLIVAIVIIILGIVAAICVYSNIATQVKMDVQADYEKQISSLQNKVEENEEKYEKKLSKEKEDYEKELAKLEESYEKKLASAKEDYKKDIEKKDKKITDLVEKNNLLLVENQIKANEIESKIKATGILTTLEYHYTYANEFEDPGKLFMALTGKSFIVRWDGVVALGVDLSKVKVTVNDASKAISIFMPAAEIIYHDTDVNSAEVLDQKNNIFNPITVEDKLEFDKRSEEIILKKVEEGRYKKDAYENAQIMIENLLKAVPNISGNYTISFYEAK